MCHRLVPPWTPHVPGGPPHALPRHPASERPTAPLRPRLRPDFDGEPADDFQAPQHG